MRTLPLSLVLVGALAACSGCGGVNVDPSLYQPLLGTRTMPMTWTPNCGVPVPFQGPDELTLTVTYDGTPFVASKADDESPTVATTPVAMHLHTASGDLDTTIDGQFVYYVGASDIFINGEQDLSRAALPGLGPLGDSFDGVVGDGDTTTLEARFDPTDTSEPFTLFAQLGQITYGNVLIAAKLPAGACDPQP